MRPVALASKQTLVDGRFRPATVVIGDDGKIADVLDYGAITTRDVVVTDVSNALIPGLIDPHVHMNEPGRTEWEGFETATDAAVAGGVTMLVDMPLNCIPVTTSRAALDMKRETAEGSLGVDVGFWGGVVPGNASELARMADAGALGAKCFLCHSGIDDFPQSKETDLREAMPVLRDAGLPLLVHAELELPMPPDCERDVRAYGTYLASRPAAWEDAAIELVVRLCRETRCAVHIVHLSSASALPLIVRAKDEGLPLTVETCPHYLCLTAEDVPDGATEFKCAPPIRERANRDALWRGLADGVIDLVTSDHSPCTPHLKKRTEGDFLGAWGGIASLSLGLPSVWMEASARGFALEKVLEKMTTSAANLAGVAHRKGRIARGFDADLCELAPDERWTVSADGLRFRHKISPYLGRAVRGQIERTWLRGQLAYRHGDAAPAERRGRVIPGRD